MVCFQHHQAALVGYWKVLRRATTCCERCVIWHVGKTLKISLGNTYTPGVCFRVRSLIDVISSLGP